MLIETNSGSVLTGSLEFVFLLAVLLSLPISFGLIWLYRHAVMKSMRIITTTLENTSGPPLACTPPPEPIPAASAPVLVDRVSLSNTSATVRDLYDQILRKPWRAAAIYAVAGACFALTMTVATLAPESFKLTPLRVLFQFWLSAWPTVLTVNVVASATWRVKLTTVIAYFFGLTILMLAASADRLEIVWQAPLAWLLSNALPTISLLAFLNRKVRAVGPLVLIFLIIEFTGSEIAIFIGFKDISVVNLLVKISGALADNIVLVLGSLGFVLAIPIAWLILRWIRHRYEQKKISDQSITLDAIWLLFGFDSALSLASSKRAVWIFSAPVAFLVYKLVTWIGFSLIAHKTGPTQRNARLLLLRVFSLGKRSERLFGALAMHWRHAGSIQLIAGPDLATGNVEPHEFLDFLSAKLAARFIDGRQAMDRRISEMDIAPDRDGRFRVNEFFCHEDTWKMVLDRLANESDAVLMDLRGFSPQNGGCVFEVDELINLVPLGQVQFIVDETTDEPFLLRRMQESWEHMRPTSPNRSAASTQLRLFRFNESRRGELRQLLRAICAAANRA